MERTGKKVLHRLGQVNREEREVEKNELQYSSLEEMRVWDCSFKFKIIKKTTDAA